MGDPLPDMPAWLDHDGYVPVPLEAAYQAASATCPADLREWVETGRVPGEDERKIAAFRRNCTTVK